MHMYVVNHMWHMWQVLLTSEPAYLWIKLLTC